MGHVASSDDAHSQFTSEADVTATWETWKAGGMVHCKNDGSPVALSVDGTVSTYRFVCTQCGASSPWFQANASGLRLRLSMTDSGSRPSARNP